MFSWIGSEWVLLGHGEQYRRFVIDCGTVGKHVAEPDARRNLDLLLERRWPNTFCRQVGISLAAIDAGYSTDDLSRLRPASPTLEADRDPGCSWRRCPTHRKGAT